jgi:DNA topoisomerase I
MFQHIVIDGIEKWVFVPSMLDEPIRADDADFKESEHPRDEDGQFTEGGGGGAGGKRVMHPAKITNGVHTTASGAPLPKHVASLKIPPAWTDVRYSESPDSALLVTGKDAKGRVTSIYSAEFSAKQAAIKFARISELVGKFERIKKQNADARKDPAKRDVSDCLDLIMHTGIRPGSDTDTGAAVKAYGASTLEGRHVRSRGGKVFLDFTGKKGVALSIPVTDPTVAKRLLERKEQAGTHGRIFGDVTHGSLLAHTHSMNGGGFKTKDFRTLLGTSTAGELVKQGDPPTDEKSYRKAVMSVARVVSEKLGNTPSIALQSYIAPEVFSQWRSHAGV